MPRYKIIADYTIRKEFEVEVPEGADPMNSANWGDIEHEYDTDCQLFEVLDYDPMDET